MAFCGSCGCDVGQNTYCPKCGRRLGVPAESSGVGFSTSQQTVIRGQYDAQGQWSALGHSLPPGNIPSATPMPPAMNGSSGWTFAKALGATSYLICVGVCGFLLAYFLMPLVDRAHTTAPPPPRLAASGSQSEAPSGDTPDAEAWAQLQRIAAVDRAALQSNQRWRAQLASSPATESSSEFLARYREIMRELPNSLLAWSGDWPSSYEVSSRSSWVIYSDFSESTTQPVIDWCASQQRDCWAKRLSDIGVAADNTDHPPADPSKN